MKLASYLRAITGCCVFSAVLISGALSAHANPATEPSTFGRCTFPSSFVFRKIVQQAVVNDLKAKNFKNPSVTVTIVAKNVRSTVKQSNVAGLTSVTSNPDGSYKVNTNGSLSVACVSDATVTIKGSYRDATGVRKTFSGAPQTVQVNGAFN